MIKKYLHFLLLLIVAASFVGCATTWGVARLPDARSLFVTTAQEWAFVAKKDLVIPYQPVGLMEIYTKKFQVCGGNLKGMYTSLERGMGKELIDKARNVLGGEAVIGYKWDVTSSYETYLAIYQSAAQANSYCGALVALGIPAAYVLNVNTVHMKGLVVKKK